MDVNIETYYCWFLRSRAKLVKINKTKCLFLSGGWFGCRRLSNIKMDKFLRSHGIFEKNIKI